MGRFCDLCRVQSDLLAAVGKLCTLGMFQSAFLIPNLNVTFQKVSTMSRSSTSVFSDFRTVYNFSVNSSAQNVAIPYFIY